MDLDGLQDVLDRAHQAIRRAKALSERLNTEGSTSAADDPGVEGATSAGQSNSHIASHNAAYREALERALGASTDGISAAVAATTRLAAMPAAAHIETHAQHAGLQAIATQSEAAPGCIEDGMQHDISSLLRRRTCSNAQSAEYASYAHEATTVPVPQCVQHRHDDVHGIASIRSGSSSSSSSYRSAASHDISGCPNCGSEGSAGTSTGEEVAGMQTANTAIQGNSMSNGPGTPTHVQSREDSRWLDLLEGFTVTAAAAADAEPDAAAAATDSELTAAAAAADELDTQGVGNGNQAGTQVSSSLATPLVMVARRLAALQQQQSSTLIQLLGLRREQLRLRQQQLSALQELLRAESAVVESTPLQMSAVRQALTLLAHSLNDMDIAAAAITAASTSASSGALHVPGRTGVGNAQDVASVAATVSCADARAEDISRMARQLLSVLREYPRRGGTETVTAADVAMARTDMPGAVFRSRTVVRGATEWELSNLPTSTCDTDHPLAQAGEVCSICLGGFGLQDTLKCMPCTHPFHTDCLNSWLRVKACCPLCKTPLPGTLITVQLPATPGMGHQVTPGLAHTLHTEVHITQAVQLDTGPVQPANTLAQPIISYPAQPIAPARAQNVGDGLGQATDRSATRPVYDNLHPPDDTSPAQLSSAALGEADVNLESAGQQLSGQAAVNESSAGQQVVLFEQSASNSHEGPYRQQP